jgi:DoxX-like family
MIYIVTNPEKLSHVPALTSDLNYPACHKTTAYAVFIPVPVRQVSIPESKMKMKLIAYWVAAMFVALTMTASGVLAVLHAPMFMKALAHLRYPSYFSNLLGLGKLIGVLVLLSPGLKRLKEWAYVSFGITILSACYSHYSSGDGWLTLEPLVTLAALIVSYQTRPATRELPLDEFQRA